MAKKNASAQEAFDNWRENNPDATKESAQKVWRMYNYTGTETDEELDESFPTGLRFKTTRVDDSTNEQTGLPRKDAPAVETKA
jgi:translation elongation factor EF-G